MINNLPTVMEMVGPKRGLEILTAIQRAFARPQDAARTDSSSQNAHAFAQRANNSTKLSKLETYTINPKRRHKGLPRLPQIVSSFLSNPHTF